MSSDTEVVIRARHLAKAYKLYDSPKDWVKQQLVGSEKNPYYKSFWALKDISFEVQRGKSLGIIGRNGCGKSTLLQIVCGMTKPTKGEIWVKGRVAPVLMFATPVFFSHEALSPDVKLMMYANILTGFIEIIRDIVVFGKLPDGLVVAWTVFLSALTFWTGYWFFRRQQDGITDVI